MAILIASLFAFYLFPIEFLLGKNAFFQQGDAIQHTTGWYFYRQDEWQFPLLKTSRLNHPDGVSIVFTDSIPLAALFFKLWRQFLPADFHYFGLWHLLVLISQACSCVFLMRALDLRQIRQILPALVFVLCWPALLWRLGHTALMTHSLLILALAWYVLAQNKSWTSRQLNLGFVCTNLLALLIHPYLLVFCFTVYVAFLLQQAQLNKLYLLQAQRLMVFFGVLAVFAVGLGYISGGLTVRGFGLFSMNLTAPICGGSLYSCQAIAAAPLLTPENFIDATGGQQEGFNYLGLGLLLSLACAFMLKPAELAGMIRRHWILLALLLASALYACSNQIYWGGKLLLTYPVPAFLEKLTGTFRASGRFFWLPAYGILFLSLYLLLRKNSRGGLALVCCCAMLQWQDTQNLRERIQRQLSVKEDQQIAHWQPLLQAVNKINLYPSYGCVDGSPELYWYFQRLAALNQKLLNTGYIARPASYCEQNKQQFQTSFETGNLYVTSLSMVAQFQQLPQGFVKAIADGNCLNWQKYLICQQGLSPAIWQAAGISGTVAQMPEKPEQMTWPAAILPSQIGQLEADALQVRGSDKTGFVSYGPYVRLAQGRYQISIQYRSTAALDREVGYWDVVSGNAGGDIQTHANGKIMGSANQLNMISFEIDVSQGKRSIEIRNYYAGVSDLAIYKIRITPVAVSENAAVGH